MTARVSGSSRLVLLGVALAAVVTASGCAGVPSSGRVNLGREVAPGRELDNFDVRVLPPPPLGGESPRDIVHGFLVASVSDEDDSKVARQYLTPRAAARWNPHASVTLYDEPSLSLQIHGDGTIAITAARFGVVGDDGDYRPSPGTLSASFHLQRIGGEWRVADPPAGRLFMTLDGAPSFRPQDVYFLDPSQQVVVPDRMLFRVPRNGLPTALMRALVAGPTKWLRPAVVTAFPGGTRLLGNVPVNNGVADVNLSREVLNAGPLSRAALSAQIVWTLRQVSNITAVRIFADGAPLTVPGAAQRQPMDTWQQYDPDASGDPRLHYVDRGTVQIESIGPALRHPPAGLSRPAVSVDGRQLAGVVATSTGQTVYSGPVTSSLNPRVSGITATTPSFDRSDVAWTVVTDRFGVQRVLRLLPSGEAATVGADALLGLGTVRELRISREGTRVAAVVDDSGQTHLAVGRVTIGRNGEWSVDGFRNPLPDWTDVAGVAWNDADRLVALARETSGARSARRVPLQTDVTGYLVTTLPVGGLPPDATVLTAAPGRPIVAAAGGRMWMSTLGMWRALGPGTDPAYPG